MSRLEGPVADALRDIVEQRDYDGITQDEAVEEIVDLVSGFLMGGVMKNQSVAEALAVWQRGAVG